MMPKITRAGGPSYAPGHEPPGMEPPEAAEDEQEDAAPAPPSAPSPRPAPTLTDRAPKA